MRRTGAILITAATAAALAACHPAKLGEGRNRGDRPETVATRLDCPERQDELQRRSASADGRSCVYGDADGSRLTLSLLALDGRTPQAALQPLEDEARRSVPVTPRDGGSQTVKSVTTTSTGGDTTTEVDDRKVTKFIKVEKSGSDTGKGEQVHLDLPGLHLDAGGDKADIKAFGHVIKADDHGATVNGSWNGSNTSIEASDGGAVMRFGSVGAHAVDLTFLVAGDKEGPQGAHAAGYVARGPVAGPLVVAEVSTPAKHTHVGLGDDDHDDVFKAAKRLVGRNVGR